MIEMMPVSKGWPEQAAEVRVDPAIDARIQDLMDRNNYGALSETERAELAAHVAANKRMTIFRGPATVALGRKPG